MIQDTQIDFLLQANIDGLHFQLHRGEGIEFKPADSDDLRFVLKPADPDNDPCGNRVGLTCKVYKAYPATERQARFVDSYNKSKKIIEVSSEVSLPLERKGKVLIDEYGNFDDGYQPRRNQCPSDIIKYIELAESDLSYEMTRFLKLLRWHQCFDAPEKIVLHQALYWKTGEGTYPLTPPNIDSGKEVTFPSMSGINWGERHQDDFQRLWLKKDLIEPLGHSLLREAAVLASESPRSSILIMTSALETAIKMHISHIAPDTAWIMREMPSPPIRKILRDYIPEIHFRHDNEITYWDKIKPLIKRVEKLTEQRNKVAHTGKIPDNALPIQESLTLVSDILYILDVLAGHEWAKTRVSYEMRKVLGWPSPIEGRYSITIVDY
jgi:hypothetical protein